MTAELFRTTVPVSPNPQAISLDHTILSLGSCFSEVIGGRLADAHFSCLYNPAGTVYNPLSISSFLNRVIQNQPFTENDIFSHNGLFHSFYHHGSFSSDRQSEVLENIDTSFYDTQKQLRNMDCLVITFGTAFGYILNKTGAVVSNCHKLPASSFTRTLISTEKIITVYTELFEYLYNENENLSIILTVSPVRHLRDDPHENTVSKASLICAVHALEKRYPSLYYFPSYEILLDELRDYRFYAEDMAHPSGAARDYIWDAFVTSSLTSKARDYLVAFEKIKKAVTHRVASKNHQEIAAFAETLLRQIDRVEKQFSVHLDKEREHFENMI